MPLLQFTAPGRGPVCPTLELSLPRGSTEREQRHLQSRVGAHRTVSAAEIQAAGCSTVTLRTVRNRLLQGQLQARLPVAGIPLTLNYYGLQRHWYQARAYWRKEWRHVVRLFFIKAGSALMPLMSVCWLERRQMSACYQSARGIHTLNSHLEL
ncbi:phospholipid-transporting ATPase [Trichonephila clavipes]|nr:phospholipid-transporting ATPase [Trichonephila clavipes]